LGRWALALYDKHPVHTGVHHPVQVLAGLKISVFCPKSVLNAAWADFVSVDSFVLRICCEMDLRLVFLLAARTGVEPTFEIS